MTRNGSRAGLKKDLRVSRVEGRGRESRDGVESRDRGSRSRVEGWRMREFYMLSRNHIRARIKSDVYTTE